MATTAKLTILIPEDLRRKAKAAAALRGITVSDIVREALERFVAAEAQTATEQARAATTREEGERHGE
jgi:hypothetical protein